MSELLRDWSDALHGIKQRESARDLFMMEVGGRRCAWGPCGKWFDAGPGKRPYCSAHCRMRGNRARLAGGTVKRTLDMDGTEHEAPGRKTCHCSRSGRDCRKCGGFMHYQGIHAGYYLECEDCGETEA